MQAEALFPHQIESEPARPFLKWVGGKGKLLPHILPHLPEMISRYYEPFLGGGAVFFALVNSSRIERAFLSDVNAELVNTYQVIQGPNVDALIQTLQGLKYNKDLYLEWRARDPQTLSDVERAARMIYLNRTGFNGLYRVNQQGKFNVPFGSYENPLICDEPNLRAVHDVLSRRAQLTLQDFSVAVEGAREGDAVYFDPPYVPLSKTSNFTSYAEGGFGHDAQVKLRDLFRDLAERGVTVVTSNSDCDITRDLYREFTIHSIKARRNINSRADKRDAVGEIVVVANGRAV